MKTKIVVWFGLVFVLALLMVACSGATPNPQTVEPKSAESVVTEEPEPTESVVTDEPKSAPSPLTGEIAPDFTLPDSNGNEVSLADTLQEKEQVVIIFYYGVGCTPCMAQLREIEKDHAKYEEKGAQVIAIAVQSEKHAEYTRKIIHAQFPILADNDHAVAEAFGVNEEDGESTPSVFIINKDRQIVWSQISHIEGGGCGTERVPSETILENLG